MLIIKPAAGARYQSVIAALDEALINGVAHYTMADLEPVELSTLKTLGVE